MIKVKKKKIWLSPTGISNLSRCPRCFWLQYRKKLRQPEGIVSRLANRFDGVIKKYFDIYRPNLPPLIKGKVSGKLEDPFIETYFYHHDKDYGYMGKLDECIFEESGFRTPVDHKTSSSDPRGRETLPPYQNQLDSYAWLLEENNKKTSGVGHLIYFYPDEGKNLHEGFEMINHIVTLKTTPGNAKSKFLEGINVLESKMPEASVDCPFCLWLAKANIEIEESEKTNQNREQTLFN